MSTQDEIAGAPISWGVCEVPGWGYQLIPDRHRLQAVGGFTPLRLHVATHDAGARGRPAPGRPRRLGGQGPGPVAPGATWPARPSA